jgi:large subunit ribosomal protein L23
MNQSEISGGGNKTMEENDKKAGEMFTKDDNVNVLAKQEEQKVNLRSEETVNLFEGAIKVPKNQTFKHEKMDKKHYYSVHNPKFSNLVLNPLISEKSMAVCSNGFYTFLVDKKATKKQITHAIEKIFGIAVIDIKTIRTGNMISHWSHKKKKNLKENIGKKALIKFNPDVEIDMERVQTIMQNRTNIMER